MAPIQTIFLLSWTRPGESLISTSATSIWKSSTEEPIQLTYTHRTSDMVRFRRLVGSLNSYSINNTYPYFSFPFKLSDCQLKSPKDACDFSKNPIPRRRARDAARFRWIILDAESATATREERCYMKLASYAIPFDPLPWYLNPGSLSSAFVTCARIPVSLM